MGIPSLFFLFNILYSNDISKMIDLSVGELNHDLIEIVKKSSNPSFTKKNKDERCPIENYVHM